ncbi:hypothetical protein NDU88_003131 [Pleurodeles waltl]|uniref:Uncharacterized protein n=1 Tax=Pleurodeles waltl TaxID=8319 RepID=A0AAV7NFY9_PLEWA|nr:hypothetical protein NDU88_003131 [Pleurodeles waltl]
MTLTSLEMEIERTTEQEKVDNLMDLQLYPGGRGRATKEDGRLCPELCAVSVPRRQRGPYGGRKITLTHDETPPQPPSSRPEPQHPVAESLPAGSASQRKNGLQRGRSRVFSTRKSALLRTEEPCSGDPEEPPNAQDLRSHVETRSRAPGDLRCTTLREAQLRGRSRALESREETASLPLRRLEPQAQPSAPEYQRETASIYPPSAPPRLNTLSPPPRREAGGMGEKQRQRQRAVRGTRRVGEEKRTRTV